MIPLSRRGIKTKDLPDWLYDTQVSDMLNRNLSPELKFFGCPHVGE